MVMAALAGARAMPAQVPAPPVAAQTRSATPTGSVNGTVYVQETQRPARFAEVMLLAVAAPSGQGPERFGERFGGSTQARTDVDGTFTLNSVAAGDYYVLASAPGSIPEQALLRAALQAGADPNDLLARIPVVHVVADSMSSVTASLQRGGVLAGRLFWEDGSPAAGIAVTANASGAAVQMPANLARIRSPANRFITPVTDDRGAFRITGLASGDYVLEAMIENRSQNGEFGRSESSATLYVYAPGVFHRASAKPITVRAGEERDDVRMTIDLRGLHTVAGRVSSASGGGSVNFGRVTLTDPNDPGLQPYAPIQADGTFRVRYVPPGNYTLRVVGGSITANGRGGRGGDPGSSGNAFQPFSAVVTVTDVDLNGVTAMLTPVQSTP
jgi:hypothetical protein